ncbi:MAG: hypothetical protein DLM60_01920 [Pseudonocardiales bacterium]|nr:DUF6317 family protein [Actinomycetota bacterium]PZS23779.1 MAG: hypothetical protein DLM60_01920 [Pseudonocardiales bacterium]
MSGDFQVVLDSLRAMSGSFRTEGDAYAAIKPKLTPPMADSGDANLNNIMGVVMECLDVLHTKMGESIGEHAEKLQASHDTYERHDIDNRALFDDLMPAD